MSIKSRLKAPLDSGNRLIKSVFRSAYRVYLAAADSRPAFLIKYRPYMNDKTYLKRLYMKNFGRELNLSEPVTFNEKNNWRKLYDRRPEYTGMVDKFEFKKFAAEKCGSGHTFRLLGSWDDPKDIDISLLPEQFVLKANHAGGVIVCRDKSEFDPDKAKKELRRILKTNYFAISREWPYKNVKRKVICEEYMGENLTDYKNYCFGGKLQYTFVWKNESRKDGRKPQPYFCGAYDRNWKKTDLEIGYPTLDENTERPDRYDEMVEIAEKLSKDIPFVRVDCYIVDHHVYAGEMTFFPWGGFMKFKDEKWDLKLGELERLPE